MLDDKDRVDSINDNYWTIRAEVIPEDQRHLADDERLVQCCHMTPERPSPSVRATAIIVELTLWFLHGVEGRLVG